MASDSQLRSIAKVKSVSDYTGSPKRNFEYNFATAIPIMDSFLTGVSQKGSLKQKAIAGGKQLKDWGIFLVVTNLYNKAINSLVSKSETLQNFRDNSPFAFMITNAAVGTAAGISGIHYINKGFSKFVAPHIPESVKSLGKNILGSADNSGASKVINNGMKTFSKNYPKITKGLGTVAQVALPLMCLGLMASMAFDMVKAKVTEHKTYKELEDVRLTAAQKLAMKNKN